MSMTKTLKDQKTAVCFLCGEEDLTCNLRETFVAIAHNPNFKTLVHKRDCTGGDSVIWGDYENRRTIQ